jgi:hypothetical protein
VAAEGEEALVLRRECGREQRRPRRGNFLWRSDRARKVEDKVDLFCAARFNADHTCACMEAVAR